MWQIKIQDPSGETRRIPLSSVAQGSVILGTDEHADILLRDPTVPSRAAILWTRQGSRLGASQNPSQNSPYWLRVEDNAPSLRLGDLDIREAHLPAHLPLQLGETRLSIEPRRHDPGLPSFPAGLPPWLTTSESGKQVLWMAKKAATTPLSIYLGGETGTGKEVMAHLIHAWSDRALGPFIPINCGALPFALAESELFGHAKGAFTGAHSQRPGAFMQAHNGTLFLDEVADLPLDIQVKLLRFLENGELRAVGADKTSRADVRVICATHKPLKPLVEEGKFRRDLYYRLASISIEIPPLRSRPEDIELLAQRFAGLLDRALSERALLRLQAHSWPGNVRELRHAIERSSGLASPFTPMLGEEAFEFLLTAENIESTPELELGAPVLTLEEMERVLLLKALKISRGNRAKAARILGVARSTLFEMIKRHRVQGPRTQALAFM